MKTVIEMALQAGIFHEYDSEGHWDGLTNEALVGKDWLSSKEHKLKRIAEILTPFAELVRADEREACAGLCDRFANRMMDAEECADAIRARGQS